MTASAYLSGLRDCVPVADGDLDQAMSACAKHLAETRARRGIVHLVGNGGSASVVAHAQNDLVKAGRLRALVHQDVPLLTATSNDHGYHRSYADQLAIWMDRDDVLIAVSSSGASPNIIHAAAVAKGLGATVVTCTGFRPDNDLRAIGDINFYVPSSDYGSVELTHAALLHCLTDRLADHA